MEDWGLGMAVSESHQEVILEKPVPMVAWEVMTRAEGVEGVPEVSTFARKLREGETRLLTGGIPRKITW